MGFWVHTEQVSFNDYIEASLARARDPEPWRKTARDESLFRGSQLARALVLAQLSGKVTVKPAGESSAIASVTVVPELPPDGFDPVRGAAVRVLAQTTAIQSAGRIDSSDIQTSSSGGDVGAWPIVAGVCVVSLGILGFLGYSVHEYVEVVDHNNQREADMAKLKAADAQALAIVKQHTDREVAAGKALPLDEATKAALAAAAKVQELIAQKQTVPDSPDNGGFFSGFSPTQIVVGAALGLGAVLLLQGKK